MSICKDCNQEMLEANSCIWTHIGTEKGKKHLRNTTYFDDNERCHDCSIINKPGNIHHSGCDMERCPRCERQFISCGCWIDEELSLFRSSADGTVTFGT